ncbi:MAG: hypothetical protein M3075_12955 [Candidatus Dormibacteraeota bacterium]|nr:hypothetical protein [Candidatus Dormibacteraeota bacterium]MDQ6900847.1 hypothetical protein [Candidatus Dormibacteraeota bacterium]
MTVPPKRRDDRSRRIPDEQRVLGSYELQLRSLIGVQSHARPIVERLEGQPALSDQAASILDYIDNCKLDDWIGAVNALRLAMEMERR